MLYILGGLPGAGKSALSRSLARARQAVYPRIDTIEQAMREGSCRLQGPEGYGVRKGSALVRPIGGHMGTSGRMATFVVVAHVVLA